MAKSRVSWGWTQSRSDAVAKGTFCPLSKPNGGLPSIPVLKRGRGQLVGRREEQDRAELELEAPWIGWAKCRVLLGPDMVP